MHERELDILLWGVTGWTGVHLVEYMLKNYAKSEVKFGMVCRNEAKLNEVKQLWISEIECFPSFASKQDLETYLNSIPTFFVSNDDEAAVAETVRKAFVICSVVGPFALHGSILVKQCVEQGTHYTDITGEIGWIEDMLKLHDVDASSNGTWIVPSCGCDSVPSDISVFACMQELRKDITFTDDWKVSVEGNVTVLKFNNRDTTVKNQPMGGGGSAASLLGDHVVARKVPKHIASNPNFPKQSKDLKKLGLPKYRNFSAMAEINQSAVYRSQTNLQTQYPSKFSYSESLASPSLISALQMPLVFGMFNVINSIPLVNNLVASNLPKPSSVPIPLSKDHYDPGQVDMVTIATAKSKSTKEKRKVVARMFLPDEPGWVETAKLLLESALTLLLDDGLEKVRNESGRNGGVLTPACMGSALVNRIKNAGIVLEVSPF